MAASQPEDDGFTDDERQNRTFMMSAISHRWQAAASASEELRGDREFMLMVAKKHWEALQYATLPLRGDPEFMKAVVRHTDWQAIEYASEQLRGSSGFMLALLDPRRVTGDPHAWRGLQFASEELRSDRQFMAAAVERSCNVLHFASQDLRCNSEFMIEAVRKNWGAFQYAAKELHGNRDFMQVAVTKSPQALLFAFDHLLSDEEFLRALAPYMRGSGLMVLRVSMLSGASIVKAIDTRNPWTLQQFRRDCASKFKRPEMRQARLLFGTEEIVDQWPSSLRTCEVNELTLVLEAGHPHYGCGSEPKRLGTRPPDERSIGSERP